MIIRTLQLYKPSWQILLNKKIHLDFFDGEIRVLIGYPNDTWEVDKSAVHNFNFASPLLPSKLHRKVRAWETVKKVDNWMEMLNVQEKEAVFWRFINHDFEIPPIQQERIGLYYKTLPEGLIAARMKISRTKLRNLLKNALEKIYKFEGGKNYDNFEIDQLPYCEYDLWPG